jgi:hypothetical protein
MFQPVPPRVQQVVPRLARKSGHDRDPYRLRYHLLQPWCLHEFRARRLWPSRTSLGRVFDGFTLPRTFSLPFRGQGLFTPVRESDNQRCRRPRSSLTPYSGRGPFYSGQGERQSTVSPTSEQFYAVLRAAGRIVFNAVAHPPFNSASRMPPRTPTHSSFPRGSQRPPSQLTRGLWGYIGQRGISLSGSYQQGYSTTYNTQLHIKVVCNGYILTHISNCNP